MSNIKIGNRKILFSNVFLIPNGEEASFSCAVDENDSLHVKITFENDEIDSEKKTDSEITSKRSATLEVEYEDDIFCLQFRNFGDRPGASYSKPLIFAESDNGETISLLASVVKKRTMMQLTLQIMLGE